MDIVDIFRALGDETRIRMLNLLKRGELCVCDFEAVLGVQQSNASRHLSRLKSAGIVVSRKNSQWVYYKFNEELFRKFPFLAAIVEDEVGEIDICQDDLAKLDMRKVNGLFCEPSAI